MSVYLGNNALSKYFFFHAQSKWSKRMTYQNSFKTKFTNIKKIIINFSLTCYECFVPEIQALLFPPIYAYQLQFLQLKYSFFLLTEDKGVKI